MNADDGPAHEEEPVPLDLVEAALGVTQPDSAPCGVGPWPFLASPGIAPSETARTSGPPHRSPDDTNVT